MTEVYNYFFSYAVILFFLILFTLELIFPSFMRFFTRVDFSRLFFRLGCDFVFYSFCHRDILSPFAYMFQFSLGSDFVFHSFFHLICSSGSNLCLIQLKTDGILSSRFFFLSFQTVCCLHAMCPV